MPREQKKDGFDKTSASCQIRLDTRVYSLDAKKNVGIPIENAIKVAVNIVMDCPNIPCIPITVPAPNAKIVTMLAKR